MYQYGNYSPGTTPAQPTVGGSIGLQGQLLGIPLQYWLIGAAIYFFMRKK